MNERKFDSEEAVIGYLKSRTDDCEGVTIPIANELAIKKANVSVAGAGMVIRWLDGSTSVIGVRAAEQLLNEGFLAKNRLQVSLKSGDLS